MFVKGKEKLLGDISGNMLHKYMRCSEEASRWAPFPQTPVQFRASATIFDNLTE